MQQGLTKRQLELLRIIVKDFVETGDPIGSKVLVDKYTVKISSATIRKEMSFLEQVGLLQSMHTSSGRIPTEEAIRIYINELLDLYELSETQKIELDNYYNSGQLQVENLLQKVSQVLAMSSESMGIVTAPVCTNSIIKRVELVSVKDNMVLLIMISGAGSIFQKKIKIDKAVSQEELYEISRFLNQNMKGFELSDLQQKGLEFLSDASDKNNVFVKQAEKKIEIAVKIAQELIYSPPEQQFFIEGQVNFFSKISDQIENKKEAEQLFNKIKNKNTLKALLIKSKLKEKIQNGINAQVGLEIDDEIYSGFSILTKNYSIGGKAIGTLSIIGLNRMNYEKIIPILDYSSTVLTQALSKANEFQFLPKQDKILLLESSTVPLLEVKL